jgi:hypothetical protein
LFLSASSTDDEVRIFFASLDRYGAYTHLWQKCDKESDGDLKRDRIRCNLVYTPSGTRVVSSHLLVFINDISEIEVDQANIARDAFRIRRRQGIVLYVFVFVTW